MQASSKPAAPPRVRWQRFTCDEAAATSIEYAVLAAGIALAILATVTALGTGVSGLYNHVSSSLN